MSRAWVTAAVVFFFLSCALGAVVMAELKPRGFDFGPDFGSPDAGSR